MKYHIAEITRTVNGRLSGSEEIIIRHILTDSRSLLYPAETLFFAIVGERNNGHDYINDLYLQGVRGFVVSRLPDNHLQLEGASFILVSNVLYALQQLAAQHRRLFLTPVIGITGSNGKTVVKEWIFQAIHYEKNIVRSPKSYNSQVGVPLSVCLLEEEHNLAIFEAGISKPGEMDRLQTIIQPDIGIFTHLGEAHQENFASLEEKAREKLKLFKRCRTVIYNRDCPEVAQVLEKDPEYKGISLFSWSKEKGADLYISHIEKEQAGTRINISYRELSFDVFIPFTDNASIENATHVTALMLFMGYAPEIISQRVSQLIPVAMRMDIRKGINRCIIINDSYNADISSLSIALDLLTRQQQHTVYTVILSDILQSGKTQKQLYGEVAGLLSEKHIHRLIGIGPEISTQAGLFTCEKYFFESTGSFTGQLGHSINFSDEAILIKGSRPFEFERIVQLLEDKVHKTVMEINLNALIHNYNYFKSLLKPETRMIIMVKAFAYGSGSTEIANILQYHHADYLAVAFADEGKDLRENGIRMPIIVMNPEEGSLDTLIRYNLEPEIYNFRMLQMFGHSVSEQGLSDYPVHIKLDSGMHRLGFMQNELEGLATFMNQQRALRIRSVFSHLAGSDNNQLDDFTHQQINAFHQMSEQIRHMIPYPFMRHILNSAGIERFPESQFDMVRLGIGIHGISAIDDSKVRQVDALRSVIIQVKEIPAGDSVGYNRNAFVASNTRIGIIPIGYADGIHRMLGNGRGAFLINGQKAPTIGNISMDMCAVDLTGINAGEGDIVTIFGEEYPIMEIAGQMQTIPYEVLTRIAPRVKRIYFQE